MKIKKKPSSDTLKNYNASFSYIKLFISTDSDISSLDSMFWNDLQSNLIKTPRDYSKTTALLKQGIDAVIITNEAKKEELKSKLKKIKSKDMHDILRLKYDLMKNLGA